jgi:hypothetical protein
MGREGGVMEGERKSQSTAYSSNRARRETLGDSFATQVGTIQRPYQDDTQEVSDEEEEEEEEDCCIQESRVETLILFFLPFTTGATFFSSFVLDARCDSIRENLFLLCSTRMTSSPLVFCETCAIQWTKYSTGRGGN